jgi:hypothetical protein
MKIRNEKGEMVFRLQDFTFLALGAILTPL